VELSQNEIEKQLLAITLKFLQELKAERAIRAVSITASLERELGIDSLAKVELFRRIESNFAIRLGQEQVTKVESLRDLAVYIKTSRLNHTAQQESPIFSSLLETTSLDVSTVKTLVELIILYGQNEPNRPHIFLQNDLGREQIISYGSLLTSSLQVSKGLRAQGIQVGDTVAIMLPTSEDFFYAFCGTLLAGAIPVPIYPPYREDRIEEYVKREVKILSSAEVRILITFAKAETLSNIFKTHIPSLTEITTVPHLQKKTSVVTNLSETNIDWSPQETDIVLIQYTSGSTGDPKGVTLLHQNMLANIHAIGKAISIKSSDSCVSWLPLYHDMGLMTWLASLYYGLPVTILSPFTFLMRPEQWLWAIHFHRATLSGGPNFAYELCAKKILPEQIKGLDLSSWRFAFNGAEEINPDTLKRFSLKFEPYGFNPEAFAPVYGLAENTVALTFPTKPRIPRIDKVARDPFETENIAIPPNYSHANDNLEFIACGQPLQGHDVRIVNDSGKPLNERFIGNIQFKGPSAMQGYFHNTGATQKAFVDGWWDTGDLGYCADNELFITGRKKDLIIKAGRNISPEAIENVVNEIPAIRKGCVIAFGVNDPKIGTEKLVIVAETAEQAKNERERICNDIIEKTSIAIGIPPDDVVLIPPRAIPKTSSGKLQRSTCKQEYLNGNLNKAKLSAKFQFLKLFSIHLSKLIYNCFAFLGKILYLIYVGIILLIMIPPLWINMIILPKALFAKSCKFAARNLFRLAGCPINVNGTEYLSAKSPMIYVSNHASYVDSIILVGILPPNISIVGKRELLSVPIIGEAVKKLGYISINRMASASSSIEEIKIDETAVKQGRSILVFPEGTFDYATGLRPFKLGAFILSADTGVPVCPIAIHGTRAILRSRSFLPKPGPVNITIGKPISPTQNDWDTAIELHDLARTEIAKHCGEPILDLIVAGLAGRKIRRQ